MPTNEKPVISISIVNYNSTKYLINCLSSISRYSQGLDIEVLVIDNASSDFKSSLVCEVFPNAVVTCNEENMGFARAHNQNFRLSNGDYFFILNPDTLITEHCLHAMRNIFKRFNDVAVVSPNLITMDGKNIVTVKNIPTIKSAFVELLFVNKIISFFHKKTICNNDLEKDTHREVDCIDGAAFMVRAKIYEILGGLDERFFMYFEEVDFCKRVKDIGGKMYFLPGVTMYHLYGKSTIGTDIRQTIYYESYYKFFRKHHGMFMSTMIRVFILAEEIIRLVGIQIKYFPLIKGVSTYLRKVKVSTRLISWTIGLKSESAHNM